MPQKRRPVMLVVLDGWGWREEAADNAVRQARTPNFDRLWATCPHAFLHTSGKDVGLPPGQMGNSEVGHLNIGAGRLVMQDLPRITDAIADGEIEKAPALRDLIERLRQTGGTCHLMGLVSPGGVHSHQDHAAALAKILADAGVPTVVHAFTDGRDTPPRSAGEDIARLDCGAAAIGVRSRPSAAATTRWIATSAGSASPRPMTAIVEAEGPRFPDARAVDRGRLCARLSDEFVLPAVVGDYRGMRDGDGVLCFNFRADRVREILARPARSGVFRLPAPAQRPVRGRGRHDAIQRASSTRCCRRSSRRRAWRTSSARSSPTPAARSCAWPRPRNIRTSPISSTAAARSPIAGEDRIMVPSPKVATYDLQPEMSAPELTDKAVEAIDSGKYDLIVLNYANPDMVGHTGSLPAAIKAVETVDAGLGRIAEAIRKAGGALLVTADHGNCEMMRDPETGGPHTAHTTNPVPVLLHGRRQRVRWRKVGSPTSRRPCSS